MLPHQKKEKLVDGDQEGGEQCPIPDLGNEQWHKFSKECIWHLKSL